MNYFIDTCFIINVLNKQQKEIDILSSLAQQGSLFHINRIVYVETLRTIDLQKTRIFRESKALLDNFEMLVIKPEIYAHTINFSRYCKPKGINLKGKCELIDFIHFVTAKYYQLEILSNDRDIKVLTNVWNDYLQTQNNNGLKP